MQESVPADEETLDYSDQEIRALAQKLVEYGLELWEVEVLLEHDVNKRSFKEIAEAGGYTSVSSVFRIYKTARRKGQLAYTNRQGS